MPKKYEKNTKKNEKTAKKNTKKMRKHKTNKKSTTLIYTIFHIFKNYEKMRNQHDIFSYF